MRIDEILDDASSLMVPLVMREVVDYVFIFQNVYNC